MTITVLIFVHASACKYTMNCKAKAVRVRNQNADKWVGERPINLDNKRDRFLCTRILSNFLILTLQCGSWVLWNSHLRNLKYYTDSDIKKRMSCLSRQYLWMWFLQHSVLVRLMSSSYRGVGVDFGGAGSSCPYFCRLFQRRGRCVGLVLVGVGVTFCHHSRFHGHFSFHWSW